MTKFGIFTTHTCEYCDEINQTFLFHRKGNKATILEFDNLDSAYDCLNKEFTAQQRLDGCLQIKQLPRKLWGVTRTVK